MDRIEAGWENLRKDAIDSASTYLDKAIECIDGRFGKGYAKEHPELIVGYMKTAEMDYQASLLGKCIQQTFSEGFSDLRSSLHFIGTQFEKIQENI